MALEELTDGISLSEDQIVEYGFQQESRLGNSFSFKSGRSRIYAELANGKYTIALIAMLPYLGSN